MRFDLFRVLARGNHAAWHWTGSEDTLEEHAEQEAYALEFTMLASGDLRSP